MRLCRGAPAATRPCPSAPCRSLRGARLAAQHAAAADDPPPDWDRELSIFRARTTAPNQLETLRRLEAATATGSVLHAGDGVALVAGLEDDAPVGTVVKFSGGGRG